MSDDLPSWREEVVACVRENRGLFILVGICLLALAACELLRWFIV